MSWQATIIAGLVVYTCIYICLTLGSLNKKLSRIAGFSPDSLRSTNELLGDIKQRLEWINNAQERQWKEAKRDPALEFLSRPHP